MTDSIGGGIFPMTLDDLDDFVEMHARFINYGDGVRPYYKKELESEDTVAFKYVFDGKTVGMILFAPGILVSGEHEDVKGRIKKIVGDGSIYTGEAIFVLPEYRQHRIADILNDAVLLELKNRRVKFVMRELWVHENGRIPAHFARGSFGPYYNLGIYPHFYKDFYKWGFICARCGRDCRCSAEIIVNRIDSEGDGELEIKD